MSQVRSSFCAVADEPALSSVDRRPPEATELASSLVARVPEHAPCCGVSTSGQTHAACSPAGGLAASPPGQNTRNVLALAVYVTPGAETCTSMGKTPNWL